MTALRRFGLLAPLAAFSLAGCGLNSVPTAEEQVNAQWAKIALEGALSIGGTTTGMLQASNYKPGESLQGLGVIAKNTPKPSSHCRTSGFI